MFQILDIVNHRKDYRHNTPVEKVDNWAWIGESRYYVQPLKILGISRYYSVLYIYVQWILSIYVLNIFRLWKCPCDQLWSAAAWVLYVQWTWNLEQECGYVAWNSAGFTPLPLKALFDSWRQWQQTTVAEACWEEGWMIQEHLRQLSASTLSSRMCSHTGGSECGTGSWGKDDQIVRF